MKIITIALFSFLLIACSDTDLELKPGSCVRVSWVRGICSQVVLKIEDPRYASFGENVDGLENVFLGILECGTDEPAIEGKTFYVVLDPTDYQIDCVRCMAAVSYTGSLKFNVRVANSCTAVED